MPSARTDHSTRLWYAGVGTAMWLGTTSTTMPRPAAWQAMRDAGLDDGEILEVNQVTAYFSYANRTVLGLGVNTKGDILGLSPGDSSDPDNWSHG